MRLMDPDTVMGRPTEGANTSKEPTQAHPDVSTMDAESARRESIAAKILQRAELSKVCCISLLHPFVSKYRDEARILACEAILARRGAIPRAPTALECIRCPIKSCSAI